MDPMKPAIEIRQKDLDKNTEAFVQCFRALAALDPAPTLNKVLDVRFGLGGWSRALLEMNPDAKIVGFEADKSTWETSYGNRVNDWITSQVFNEKFPPEAGSPGYEAVRSEEPFDLLLADINALTAKQPKEMLKAMAWGNPRAIIMTDIACAKLHINYPFYGLSSPDFDAYVEHFRKTILPEWTLVHTAKLHFFAASMAWIRK